VKWSRIVSFLHLIFDKSHLQNKKSFQYSGMIELQELHSRLCSSNLELRDKIFKQIC